MIQLKLISEPNGADQSTFEVGENLLVELTGCNATELYTVEIEYSGSLLFFCKFLSDPNGKIESVTFWNKLGMDNPTTGVLYSYPQAQTEWQGKQLDITIKDSTSTIVFNRSITISTSPVKPFFVGTDINGVIGKPEVEGTETIYAGIYNLSAGSYRLYMVLHHSDWKVGDNFTVASKLTGGTVTKDFTVTTVTSGSGQIIEILPAAETVAASYDFIIRPIPPIMDDTPVLKPGDIFSRFDLKTARTQLSANSVPRCCASEMPMSGRSGTTQPYFFYSNTFRYIPPPAPPTEDRFHDIYLHVQPNLLPQGRRSKNCAIYIVPHVEHRVNNSALQHLAILGGNPAVQIVSVSATGEIPKVKIWDKALQLPGEYDIVLDFGNNPVNAANFIKDDRYNCPLDYVDSYYLPGLRIVADDPQDAPNIGVGIKAYGDAPKPVLAYENPFYNADMATDPSTTPFNTNIYFPATVDGTNELKHIKGINNPVIILVAGSGNQVYTNYDGLLRHLAKNGFVAVTIEESDTSLNRAMAIKLHLDAIFTLFNTTPEVPPGAIQNNIGLIGHSQGGEAVVLATRLNKKENWGYHINAVVSLAPSDSWGYEYIGMATYATEGFKDWRTPYFVLYGSMDGDVVGDFQPGPTFVGGFQYKGYRASGFAMYDKSFGIEKSMLFVYGATHNRFLYSGQIDGDITLYDKPAWDETIDNFQFDTSRPPGLIPKAHHTLGEAYFNAFFQLHLMSETKWAGIFKGEWIPPSVEFRKTEQFGKMRTYIQYENHSSQDKYSPIDYFERIIPASPPPPTPSDPPLPPLFPTHGNNWPVSTNDASSGNTIPGATVATTLPLADIEENYIASRPITKPNTFNGLDDHSPHRASGLRLKWTRGKKVFFNFPPRNVQEFTVLSFRITQKYTPNSSVNTPNLPQDFTITLTDSQNRAKNVRVSSFGEIPYPHKRLDDDTYTKSAMVTIRIPLNAFRCANDPVSLTSIRNVTFYFSEKETGEIIISSLEFAK